jgi:Rieske Fe-S protein
MTVYESTPVLEVQNGTVYTKNGTVSAENVVIATHYPFINVPGYYFMRLSQERSYVIALENAMLPNGEYLGVDKDHGLSIRSHNAILLLGGGGHRTGAKDCGRKYELLRSAAARFWPGSKEVAHWSAQDCMTLDGVPYIGRFSSKTPDMYVATGFEKWGMTSAMVSAMIISDMICGKTNDFSEIFSPARFNLTASLKNIADNTIKSVSGLSAQVYSVPQSEADRLSPGRASTAEIDGERVGLYKDKDGTLFAVKTRCPHLGCKLEWNENELSWDCPCHGSRFSYTGELLDNPAQTDIRPEA